MTTRSQKKSLQGTKTEPKISKHVENSWILMVKDTVCQNSNFVIITLPHPAHGKPTKYGLDAQHKKMYEIVAFTEQNRSWFIGETVKSDGTVMMMTPFNPVFLAIPKLREQCSTRAVPIEDLLSGKGYEKIMDLINLDEIADVKEAGDIKAYKYNEEKTILFLEKRVRKLANVLKEKNIHVTSGASSATFLSSNSSNIDEEFYIKYAFGIVSEYLDDYISKQLEKHFNFKTELIESIGNKRKTEESDLNGVSKKLKYEKNDEHDECKNFISNTPEVKAPKTLTAKEKARQKAASGTKTISSFFTKK